MCFCTVRGEASYGLKQFSYPISFTNKCYIAGGIQWSGAASENWFTSSGSTGMQAITDVVGSVIRVTLSTACCNGYSDHKFIIIGY